MNPATNYLQIWSLISEAIGLKGDPKMLRCKNEVAYENLSLGISDNFIEGETYNLKEIVDELTKFEANFDTHSMNDTFLFLQGQKDMLSKIILYLKKILGEE
jgi:hypothetical protein